MFRAAFILVYRMAFDAASHMRAKRASRKAQRLCMKCAAALAAVDVSICSTCKQTARNAAKVLHRKLKRLAIDLLGGKCVDCGLVTKFLSVYDFHHLDPSEKDGNLSHMFAAGLSWEAIEPELLKCELICSNCHRIRHEKEDN